MKTKHLLLLLFLFTLSAIFSEAKAQVDISVATITGLEQNYLHSGYAVTPTPVLSNDSTLKVNESYTLAYSNNVALGTASLTITGIGSYTGTVIKNFHIVNATRSIGYNLWDSNGEVTSTLDTLDLKPAAQIIHIQIKFDKPIQIVDAANLRSQFVITLSGSSSPETSSRTVYIAVNSSNASILDIAIPSLEGVSTAQTNNKISIQATNLAGWIPALTDTDGNAVNLIPITTIQPTGLAFKKVNSTLGTETTPATATYKISSIPLVRAMNFIQARTNKSPNANGYIASEYFTVHSHTFYSMTAQTYLTSLISSANITTFSNAGYTLEKVAVESDAANPLLKLSAKTAADGEEISCIVYHYPNRSAADRKYELSQIIDTITTASTSLIDAANLVLYDLNATTSDVAAAITSLQTTTSGVIPAGSYSNVSAVTGGKHSIVVKGVKQSGLITVYGINGQVVVSRQINSDIESIYIEKSGLYIVKVNGAASKVFVK